MNRAEELLNEASGCSGKSWYDYLNVENQKFILEVVNSLMERPDVSVYSVAMLLKKKLGIDRSHGTIVRTLKEVMKNV